MTLFTRYVQAVIDTRVWPDKLKIGLVEWAIAEQGNGRGNPDPNCMDELARYADNYHSLHVRKEMTPYYPCVYHLKETREIDNNYIDFNGPAEELEGLLRFIHRPGYGDIDAHMGSFEELLRHLCPSPGYSFCPTLGYIDRVLSFRAEAEAELRKLGWTPEEEPVVIPQPTQPPSTGYNVRKGLLYVGDNPVPYFESPYKDKWVMNEPTVFVFHFTANDNFDGQCKYFQKNGPGVSPHLLVGEVGQVAQFVPFHKPAHHAGSTKWNKSIGIEVVNLGCSRVAVGNYVVFVKWDGVRYIPKEKCLYAHHQLEPNIWRWWPDFTAAQYAAINAFVPPIRAEFEPRYGKMGMIGHESVCAYKVDPGPNFKWNLITMI
jgi:N-acetyl-anhydromuramyl-L-alanine amidase AmpD